MLDSRLNAAHSRNGRTQYSQMKSLNYLWPANRQVLVNVGNRFVVFGSAQTLPQSSAFSPSDLPAPSSRVPDEKEVYAQRTVESVRVSDAEVRHAQGQDPGWDFEIVSPEGSHTLVEMKVRERDPKRVDYQQMFEQLQDYAASLDRKLEIWVLNVERLTLHIFMQNDQGLVLPIELRPIDVWDYGVKGDQPFHRSRVLEEVNEWARQINSLYAQVEEWASRSGLNVDRSRTVTMSEELMQHFAVPDREVPVLDISKGDQPIISFVPNGLWIIGAHGRIHVVTPHGTSNIDNMNPLKPGNKAKWNFFDPQSRNSAPFDEAAFASLIAPS